MSRSRWMLLAGCAVLLLALWLALVRNSEPARDTAAEPRAPASRSGPRLAPVPALPAPDATAPPPANLSTSTNVPAANAADFYRKAFALLDALSADEKKALGDWKGEMDPAVAAELCGKLQPICALAHEAAALTNCDWGIKQLSFETPLPHLSKARNLARGLVWSAAHCRSDDASGAGDDLAATLRLGHGVSQLLIGHLVNTAIEATTINFIAANAGTLPRESAARLMALLSDDSYSESLYRALETEAEFASRAAARIATMSPEARKDVGDGTDISPMPPADIVAAGRQVSDLEREYAQVLGATDAEYHAFLDKVHAAEATNPLLKMVWPATEAIEDKTRAMIVQRAMTVAGLAVAQEGPGALAGYADPATGQPFQYQATPTGFELQSAYQQKGKPMALTFVKP